MMAVTGVELSPARLDELWGLYESAYGRTVRRAPTAEVVSRAVFDRLMTDPAVRVWVAGTDAGPSALLAVDTANVGGYLEPVFWNAKYPGRPIWYILWAVGDGAMRLLRAGAVEAANAGAVVVADGPACNRGIVAAAHMLGRAAGAEPPVLVDVRRCWAVDFGD